MVTEIAGPSSTWQRAGSAGWPGGGCGREPGDVSAETSPARRADDRYRRAISRGDRVGADVHDDLVHLGVSGGGDLPGQERLGDDQQRVGQARRGHLRRPVPGGRLPDPRSRRVSAETPGSCAACGCSGSAGCGWSRSPAAARSAFSSTAPCSGGSRNVPGQRSVLLEPPGQPAPHPSRGVIDGADLPVGPGETFQLVRRSSARRSRPGPPRCPGWRSGSAPAPSHTTAGPRRTPPRITGRSRSARATRTCSRAVPEDIWHFHDSHAAQLVISQSAQPRRASKSPSRTRNRHVAAARCPASSQICASSRSSGTEARSGSGPGSVTEMVPSGAGARLQGIEHEFDANTRV